MEQLLIGGRRRDARDGATYQVREPASGEVLAEVAQAGPADVDDALADRVLDAYGLFGSPGHCAERLRRACAELDPTRLFLFPAHSWETTYDLPEETVAAAASALVPALEELS